MEQAPFGAGERLPFFAKKELTFGDVIKAAGTINAHLLGNRFGKNRIQESKADENSSSLSRGAQHPFFVVSKRRNAARKIAKKFRDRKRIPHFVANFEGESDDGPFRSPPRTSFVDRSRRSKSGRGYYRSR